MQEPLDDQARRYALAYCKPPKVDPITGGMRGAGFAMMIIGFFVIVAGLDLDDFELPYGWSIIAGFIVPFLYYAFQRRKFDNAVFAEYEKLRQYENAKKACTT